MRFLVIILLSGTFLVLIFGYLYFFAAYDLPKIPAKLLIRKDPFEPLLKGPVDAIIKIEGRVYERTNNSKKDAILIDCDLPTRTHLRPLRDVKVVLYLGWSSDESSPDWHVDTVTDSAGKFQLFMVCAPGQYNVSLYATKKHYRAVRKVFLHNNPEHKAIVVMSKMNAQQEAPPDGR